MSEHKNIFISHYHEDDKEVQAIKNRLEKEGCSMRNFSIDSTKHKDGRIPSKAVIKRYLNIRIKACSTFICLVGPDTHKRPWVNYEIEKAHKEGKTIVGIYKHGCKDSVQLPEKLKEYAVSLIGWNSIDKLSDIINGKISPFECPDGSPAPPPFPIVRVRC